MAARGLMVLLVTLCALSGARAFFLPWSSSSSSSGYKKPELWAQMSEMGALPLAVPYPVPVPAPAPLQVAPPQMGPKAPMHPPAQPMAFSQLGPLAQLAASAPPGYNAMPPGLSAASLYSAMQLVPCLCSVPKEELDEAAAGNGVSINAQQQPSN